MSSGRRSILIDARVNGMPGAYGLARSVVRLAEHLGGIQGDLAVRVLVNQAREQMFSLEKLSARAEVVTTDITLGAVHRFLDLARLIRDVGAAVLYVPYPMFRPLVCPCPVVVTAHDCTIESDVGFAGGWRRQLGFKVVTGAALSRASAITTPTIASSLQIRQFYPGAQNVTVIPNGIDQDPFTAVPESMVRAAADRYCLPPKFVLAVGAHRPHKNYEVLVRAMRSVPRSASLVIVGYLDPSFRQP